MRRYREKKGELDHAYSLVEIPGGGVAVVGLSVDPETSGDCVVIAYGPGGRKLWLRRLNSGGSRWDQCVDIAADSAGRLFVVGQTDDQGEFSDYLVFGLSAGGATLWQGRISSTDLGGAGNARAKLVAVDSAGSVLVSGVAGSPGLESGFDIVTLKLSGDGEPLWSTRYSGPPHAWGDEPTALAVDADGGVVVGGFTPSRRGDNRYIVLTYGPDGEERWRRRRGTKAGDDEVWAVAVTPEREVVVTGDSPRRRGDSDVLTLKFRPDGKQMWKRRWDSPTKAGDGGLAVASHSDGSVSVAGASWSGDPVQGGGGWDPVVLRYASNGHLLWESRQDTSGGGSEWATSVAADGTGTIIAGGGWGEDYLISRYLVSGEREWLHTYDGPGHNSDIAEAAVVLGDGGVAVTGLSVGKRAAFDFATIVIDR